MDEAGHPPGLAGEPDAEPLSKKPVVILIEDEPEIRRFLRASLTGHGYRLFEATTGAEGLREAESRQPDIVVLDLGLPDIDGLEVIRRLREWTAVPIIVLSARDNEADKLLAFEEGADDYITKPFGMAELVARIRVALRHAAQSSGSARGAQFEANGLCLDFERRHVRVDGLEVHLMPTEYELLKYLALHVGKVITHRTLLRAVWGQEGEDATHYVRVCIGQLRRKIEPEGARTPRFLLTEPGIGYRLRGAEGLESADTRRVDAWGA
jgi:two-component system KDP operon response regulator KdpE